MPLRINVDDEGAPYLAYAKTRLIALKIALIYMGLEHLQKTIITPDGQGLIELRTQRLGGQLAAVDPFIVSDPYMWQDYIRIEAATPRGYLFQPFVRLIATDTVLIADSPPLWRLPIKGGAFREFKGYNVADASNVPQVDGKHTTTGMGTNVFVDGKLRKLPTPLISLGKWKHKYTESGDALQRLMSMVQVGSGATQNYRVADSVDGILTESGDNRLTGTNGLFTAYGVHGDGKRAVVDYGAFDKRYMLDIDYARVGAKIATTRFTDASPWGTWTQVNTFGGNLDGTPTLQTWSGVATFPTAYGPVAGAAARIQVEWGYPASLINTMSRSYSAEAVSTAWNYARCASLRMPNGFKVDIPDVQVKSSSVVTATSVSYTNEETNVGNLEIIYVDPTVPAVLYKSTYEHTVGLPDTYVVTPAEPFASMTGTLQRETKQDLRLIIGDQQRTLHTRTLSTTTSALSVDASLTPEIDITGGTGLPVPITSFPANYLKQLRTVVPPDGSGSLDRYVVDIRDVDNWVIGYTQLDTSPPQFFLYAGALNEVDLRANFVALLIKLLTEANIEAPDPILATAIADLQAGNYAPYDIRLNGLRPISPGNPNIYEPRVGVASLI